jgi:hypothetical protein
MCDVQAKGKNAGKSGGGGGGGVPQMYLIGGAVAVLAALYFLMPGVTGMLKGSSAVQLSVDKADEIKEVFYGGKPWVVLCDSRSGKSI